MNKIAAALLLTLTLCACAGRDAPPRLSVDARTLPAFPPPPVDRARPLPSTMLPDLTCLQATGSPSCDGPG